jgi:hypothetical protein
MTLETVAKISSALICSPIGELKHSRFTVRDVSSLTNVESSLRPQVHNIALRPGLRLQTQKLDFNQDSSLCPDLESRLTLKSHISGCGGVDGSKIMW